MDEVERLRQEVENYRQRELADLRSRAESAEQAVEHYRAEAQRNAEVGRQIAAEYEKKLIELKAKIAAYEQIDSRDTRRSIGRT